MVRLQLLSCLTFLSFSLDTRPKGIAVSFHGINNENLWLPRKQRICCNTSFHTFRGYQLHQQSLLEHSIDCDKRWRKRRWH